ncbi:phosphopyruvate hydratase [Kribbella swartbergensis]
MRTVVTGSRHRITAVDAWQVMDSRGRPTIAAKVCLTSGAHGIASVPSGASTGSHEAVELRDHGPEWLGLSVQQALEHIRGPISEVIIGLEADDQAAVDEAITESDGTPNLSQYGANAVLATSIAAAKAAAAADQTELWQHQSHTRQEPILLPMPMVNVVSGGAHARGLIDIQDILVIPIGARTFNSAIRWCFEIREATARLAGRLGPQVGLVADEGGIATNLPRNKDAVALVCEGIAAAGLEPGTDACVALDVAATNFFENGLYHWRSEDRVLTGTELVDELVDWVGAYPIASIEDPVAEDDWDAWSYATRRLDIPQLVGDDLLVTNESRLRRALKARVATSVLIKPNQIGTLTAARRVLELAQASGYTTVISARSGETEDCWLSDLAVGWRAGQIKVGSTTRSERTAKWNRLLQIEHELGRVCELARFPASAEVKR